MAILDSPRKLPSSWHSYPCRRCPLLSRYSCRAKSSAAGNSRRSLIVLRRLMVMLRSRKFRPAVLRPSACVTEERSRHAQKRFVFNGVVTCVSCVSIIIVAAKTPRHARSRGQITRFTDQRFYPATPRTTDTNRLTACAATKKACHTLTRLPYPVTRSNSERQVLGV